MKLKLKPNLFNRLEGVFFLTTGGEPLFARGALAVREAIAKANNQKPTTVRKFLNSCRDSLRKPTDLPDHLIEDLAYGDDWSSTWLPEN